MCVALKNLTVVRTAAVCTSAASTFSTTAFEAWNMNASFANAVFVVVLLTNQSLNTQNG